nr:hypothetical protein [uncultured Draconibacterium sp.]
MINNKKMINFFIVLGLIGGVIIAVSIAGYRIYSGKSNAEKEQKATEQRVVINDNISSSKNDLTKQINLGDSMIIEKVESSKTDLLEQQKQLTENTLKDHLKNTEKVIGKIEESSTTNEKNQKEILDKLEKINNDTRVPNGLYKNDTKWGTVINFELGDDKKTFTIEKINFDNPIRNINDVWSPFEYDEYLIKITNVNSIVMLMPPGAEGVKGIILEKNLK